MSEPSDKPEITWERVRIEGEIMATGGEIVERVREVVTDPAPNENGIAVSAAGQKCFHCGNGVADRALFWSGAGQDIYFHESCAVDFAIGFIRDLHEIRNPAYYERRRRERGLE